LIAAQAWRVSLASIFQVVRFHYLQISRIQSMAATSLKPSEALKRRIVRLAGAANKTPTQRLARLPISSGFLIFSQHRIQRLRVNASSALGGAFELLTDHPLLGREAENGRREFILSRGKFGYVAKLAGCQMKISF